MLNLQGLSPFGMTDSWERRWVPPVIPAPDTAFISPFVARAGAPALNLKLAFKPIQGLRLQTSIESTSIMHS